MLFRSLQSPADLTHIQGLIRAAALQKLNLHLPPAPASSANEPDDLRRKTEELVDGFVAQVLEGLRANISINGMDVVDAEMGDTMDVDKSAAGVEEVEYEDLDNKQREKLRVTIAKRDNLISKIATHRRGTAALASQRFREQFEAEVAEMARRKEESEALAAGMEGRESEIVGGDGLPLKRREEVEKSWERAVEGLLRLNTGLAETRARLERAGEVVGRSEERRVGKECPV